MYGSDAKKYLMLAISTVIMNIVGTYLQKWYNYANNCIYHGEFNGI